MEKNPIGVFDSGIGGISVLKEITKILPNEEYIYYADSKHNPYGSKDSEELLKITSNIVDYLIDRKCKIIVIACNTATTVCIEALREKYPNMLFIGIVPAIKIAYDNNSINTLVLATPYTVKSKRVDELVSTYKHENQTITLLPCLNLANTIEFHEDKINELLKNQLQDYKDKNYDTIILGCTHYSLIKNKIKEYFPNANIVDGNKGIANETKRKLEEHNLLWLKDEKTSIEFICSDENQKEKCEYIYNL